jgi:hypothetical protein
MVRQKALDHVRPSPAEPRVQDVSSRVSRRERCWGWHFKPLERDSERPPVQVQVMECPHKSRGEEENPGAFDVDCPVKYRQVAYGFCNHSVAWQSLRQTSPWCDIDSHSATSACNACSKYRFAAWTSPMRTHDCFVLGFAVHSFNVQPGDRARIIRPAAFELRINSGIYIWHFDMLETVYRAR